MKLEVLEKDKVYHIYNRGINSETIFNSVENKQYFLKLYSKYLENKADTFAYCLMDNHFHFIIRIVNEKEITQALSNLFNAYAKAFNKQNNRTGSLFEKHFKRIQIINETYLLNLIQYVHQNLLQRSFWHQCHHHSSRGQYRYRHQFSFGRPARYRHPREPSAHQSSLSQQQASLSGQRSHDQPLPGRHPQRRFRF